MSRTLKTAPFHVKCFTQPGMIEEFHDHRVGACDLPPRPRAVNGPDGEPTLYTKTRCDWRPSSAFWNSPLGVCNCPTCGHTWMVRAKRRTDRQKGRREAREAVKDLALHVEDRFDLEALADAGDVPRASRLDRDYLYCAQIRDALELPTDVHVVDFTYAAPDLHVDATAGEFADIRTDWDAVDGFVIDETRYGFKIASVELLHPDGRREHLILDANGVVR